MLGQWYPGEGVSAPSCGTDPCDFTDYLWVSDECTAWLQCAGQPAVTVSTVLGQGTSQIASGAGTVIGSALSSPTTDLFLIVLLAGAVGIWILLDKL
jgi:hypothetical protein